VKYSRKSGYAMITELPRHPARDFRRESSWDETGSWLYSEL
jgi:hypothetical protein